MKRGIYFIPLRCTHIVFILFLFAASSCSRGTDLIDQVPDIPEATGNIPLNDPHLFTYNGEQSGLYPWGNEMISNAYESKYQSVSENIHPASFSGLRTSKPKVVILTIGGSTPAIMFEGFIHAQQNDPGFGNDLLFINGGMNAMDFSDLLNPNTNYWDNMESLLYDQSATPEDVQVMFCIEDNLRSLDTSFTRTSLLKNDYAELLNIIRTHYPNCKLFLVGDRGYSGYTDDPHHDEPIGYLNGWGVKLFVADYINGLLPEYPVVNWLDYYWADGENPRWDGLTYSQSDFAGPAYVHLHQEKADEIAETTNEKLKADPAASNWYK